MRGVMRRLSAFDGTMRVSSPPGGPTLVDAGDPVRLVLAEDHALLRDGLIRLLDAHGFTIVAAVDNEPDLVQALGDADASTRPWSTSGSRRRSPTRGCAPPSPPERPVRASRSWCSRSTSSTSTPASSSPAEQGGVGYLLKDRVADVKEFVEGVRRVAAGGTVLDPEVVAALMAGSATSRSTG